MSETALRAVAPPAELDGGDEMFPLRNAKDAGKLLGVSGDWVLSAVAEGRMPYVLLRESATGRGEGRPTIRIRNDHLVTWVKDRTVTP